MLRPFGAPSRASRSARVIYASGMLRPLLYPLVLTVTVAALHTTSARAQNVVWGQLIPSTSPAGRSQHAMAYDAVRARSVVYGGYNNAAGLADTWEWDGSTWLQRATSSPPGIRRWFAMAYDSARQRTVLFGGQSAGGNYPTDTWEWNGTTWLQVATASGAAPRWRHAGTYDVARQRFVLFGGAIPGITGTPYAADTWEWDGTAWLQRTPASSPPGRQLHGMAYDAGRQRVVLFGGLGTGGVNLADTWEWDGTNWTQALPASSPPGRVELALAYDPTRQTTLLFGGVNNNGYLGDTWEWNGVNWIASTPNPKPSNRSLHTMTFHAASSAVLLFGGGVAFADTWSTYLPATATAYGTGCGTPALGFVPDPAARPRIGTTGRANLVNAPTPLAFVAIGLSNSSFGVATLPLPLDFLGMTGCVLLQSTDVLGLGTTPVGPTTYAFQWAIPNSAIFLGKRAYLQGYALAPGQNPLEVIASNGITWLFGNV